MTNPELDRRLNLLRDLLYEMKETNLKIDHLASEIEKTSGVYYQQACGESQEEIQQEVEKYKSRISRIADISREITSKVNVWYDFSKSKSEMSSLLYPVLYYFKKQKLNKQLKKLNSEISSITIDNRFIKEKLTLLEHQLEIKAIQKIKEDNSYLEYESLLQKKELLMAELQYLLPTIPGLCPAVLDSRGVTEVLEKLSKLEVA